MTGLTVNMEIANNLNQNRTVRIPAGTVIEAAQTDMGVQNVVIVQDYYFNVPAHGSLKVILRGNCLNRGRDYPQRSPGRLTPFRYTGNSSNQSGVWDAMSSPRRF